MSAGASQTNAKRAAAELLVVGLPGPDLDNESAHLLAEVQPGGVILFRRNVASVERLRVLIDGVRGLCPGVFLSVDAEGGRVDRLAPLVGDAVAPSALAPLAPRISERAGLWIGHALAELDFDVDFAPVVDLDHGFENNALDGRYFGSTPRAVVARAGAFLEGLQRAGVGGCVKHFPGLGPSDGDTHFEAGRVDRSLAELAPDLEPYARLFDRAGMVMVCHAQYPQLDAENRPASLSPTIIDGLLRRRMGFDGVVISDDLEMHALNPWGDLTERCERALVSGCDLLAVCHSLAEAPTIVARLAQPSLSRRIAEARARRKVYLANRTERARRYSIATVRTRLAAVNALATRA